MEVGEIVTVGVLVGEGLTLGVVVSVTVGEGDVEGVTVGEGELVGVIVTVGNMLGVTEGVPIGSIAERLFCGWGVVLPTKSEELLFVSSPFPINSSAPPEAIEEAVEVGFAFLSTLVEAIGTDNDVPSPKVFVTVPNETASINVPVFVGSFLRPMLLLLATVSVEVLSQVSVAEREVWHQR